LVVGWRGAERDRPRRCRAPTEVAAAVRMCALVEGRAWGGGCEATKVAEQPAGLGVDGVEGGKTPPAGVGVCLKRRKWGALGHGLPRVLAMVGGVGGRRPPSAPVLTWDGWPRRWWQRRGCEHCNNTLSAPHPVGGRVSQTVSPGSPVEEYPPREKTPKSTHTRRRPGGDAPGDKHEMCDRKFTCPRQRPRGNTHASPSHPVCSPQTLRKTSSDTLQGPSETLLRHPQTTL